MKTLLIILLFLGFTSVALADHCDNAHLWGVQTEYWGTPIPVRLIPGDVDGHNAWCVKQMEQAMRAMEQYVGNPMNLETWTPYAIEKFNRANIQWEDTMKNCWEPTP